MIHLHFGEDDVGRVRFASSPLWETVMSIRTLLSGDTGRHLHGPWRRQCRGRLADVDMGLLTSVVRPAGYIPDFLVPSPTGRDVSFADALGQVAAGDVDEVARQLEHLAGHPVAQQGPGRPERTALLRRLAADPAAGLARVVGELDRYWAAAIAPHWPRLRALMQADLAYRLDELATGGTEQMLATLHPSVSYGDGVLRVVKYYEGHADLAGRGLLLVPCAFAWPDVIVLTSEPNVPTVSYAPRGVGRLWHADDDTTDGGLAAVLGRTRAAMLAQLDLPMSTTQIAMQMKLTAPTMSVHLQALQGAALVSSRRDGRQVLYARTRLGEAMLEGAA